MVHGLNISEEQKKRIKPTFWYLLGNLRWSNIAIIVMGFAILFVTNGTKAMTEVDVWGIMMCQLFGALFLILGLNWWQSDMDRILDKIKQNPELVDPSLAEGKDK